METAIFHPAFMVHEWSGLCAPLNVPRCLCAKSTCLSSPASPASPPLFYIDSSDPSMEPQLEVEESVFGPQFVLDALCLPLVTCAFLHKSYGFCKKLL